MKGKNNGPQNSDVDDLGEVHAFDIVFDDLHLAKCLLNHP